MSDKEEIEEARLLKVILFSVIVGIFIGFLFSKVFLGG